MKVYQILATLIVEDEVDDSRIGELCRENIETAVMEDFYISNCITHYELKETMSTSSTFKNIRQLKINDFELGK